MNIIYLYQSVVNNTQIIKTPQTELSFIQPINTPKLWYLGQNQNIHTINSNPFSTGLRIVPPIKYEVCDPPQPNPSCSGLLYTLVESFGSGDNYVAPPRWYPNTESGLNDANEWAGSDPWAPYVEGVNYVITSDAQGWCCDSTPYPPLEILPAYVEVSGCVEDPTPTPIPYY